MAREMDVGMKCIKLMLFISNFMFVMVGFLLIAIGTSVNSIYQDFEIFMEAHHFKPAELLIAIGIIIFFVALLGCLGAIKESTLIVNIYAVFLFLILILEVSAAIAAYSMRSKLYCYISKNMYDTLEQYEYDPITKNYWDFMQERLHCCGVVEPRDWNNVTIVNAITWNSTAVPQSCNYKLPNSAVHIYERGCLNQLSLILSSSALMIGIGCTCVAFVQLMGVIFATALAKTIRRIKTTDEIKRQENRMRIYEQLQLSHPTKENITPVLYEANSTDA